MYWKLAIYFLCISLFLPCIRTFSQESKARIANVRFEAVEMEGTKIVVYYDIVNASPVERFEIELAFVDDEDFYYYPVSTSGDVGVGIKGGKQKRIIWDIFKDEDEVGRIKAIVNISSITEVPGGPANALLSVPVPGLGDIFVTNTRKSVIKPFYKTILSYGLVGYGVYQRTQYNKYYDEYLASTERSEFDNLYNKATSANRQFVVFTSMGAAIWISDIIWVAVKGMSNQRKAGNEAFRKGSEIKILPNPYGGMQLSYSLKF